MKKRLARVPTALQLVVDRERIPAVAKLLSEAPRAELRRLEIAEADFDPGGEIPKAALTAKATQTLWAALPGLEELTLKGHSLCTAIAHPRLKQLDVHGFSCGEAVPPNGSCPALESLRWFVVGDQHGVALDPEALQPLWAGTQTPALTTLDLSGSEFDGTIAANKAFTQSPLRKRLVCFGLPRADEAGWRAACDAMPELARVIVTDAALANDDPRIVVAETKPAAPAAVSPVSLVRLEFVTDEVLAKARLDKMPPPIQALRLTNHDLGDDGGAQLGRAVAGHPEVEILGLQKPQIYGLTKTSLAAFQTNLGHHPGLKRLDLSGNKLVGSGEVLAALVAQLARLEAVVLDDADLTGADISALLPALSRSTTLREVSLEWSEPTDVSAAALRSFSSASLLHLALKTTASDGLDQLGARFPALASLTIAATLDADAMTTLGAGLAKSPALRSLSLTLDGSKATWAALGKLLTSSPVEELTVKEDTSDVEPTALDDGSGLRGLAGASGLKALTIHIDKNDVARHQALVETLAAMPHVRVLGRWRPAIEDVSLGKELADALAKTGIREIKDASLQFAIGLIRRDALESVWVNSMYNLTTSLDGLGPVMTNSKKLRALHLTGGELKADGAKALLAIVSGSAAVTTLDVQMVMSPPVLRDLVKKCGKLAHLTELIARVPLGSDIEALQALAPKLSCRLDVFEY